MPFPISSQNFPFLIKNDVRLTLRFHAQSDFICQTGAIYAYSAPPDGWMAARNERKVRASRETELVNDQGRKRYGKCNREQTAFFQKVRVKRCGKSAPRFWRQKRLGKPLRKQFQIGAARLVYKAGDPAPAARVGCKEAHGNMRSRGMVIAP